MLYSLLIFILLIAQSKISPDDVKNLQDIFGESDSIELQGIVDLSNLDLDKPIPHEPFYFADEVLRFYKGAKWTYSDIITESAYNAGYGTTRWDKYFPYESGMDLEKARADTRRAFYKRVRNTTFIIVYSICALDLLVVFSVYQIKKRQQRKRSRKNYIRRSIGFKTESNTQN